MPRPLSDHAPPMASSTRRPVACCHQCDSAAGKVAGSTRRWRTYTSAPACAATTGVCGAHAIAPERQGRAVPAQAALQQQDFLGVIGVVPGQGGVALQLHALDAEMGVFIQEPRLGAGATFLPGALFAPGHPEGLVGLGAGQCSGPQARGHGLPQLWRRGVFAQVGGELTGPKRWLGRGFGGHGAGAPQGVRGWIVARLHRKGPRLGVWPSATLRMDKVRRMWDLTVPRGIWTWAAICSWVMSRK